MTGTPFKARALAAFASALLMSGALPAQDVQFLPATAAHGYAVRAYQAIWDQDGERILAALEARTCLDFPEDSVSAIVDRDELDGSVRELHAAFFESRG